MKMSEFLNMDMGELSDWIIENGHDYTAIKNDEHDRLTEENAKLRELVEFAFKEGAEEGFYGGGYFSMSKSQELLNQLKDQDNDK